MAVENGFPILHRKPAADFADWEPDACFTGIKAVQKPLTSKCRFRRVEGNEGPVNGDAIRFVIRRSATTAHHVFHGVIILSERSVSQEPIFRSSADW